ncbi:hypothetical protein [Leptospira interrogans]|uniref:hypothetical protein n=1 Tax=Leptospira interrogans TaxID=173 RepID=UPI000C1FBC29|nr:hypothetical protein [Leptospira interrogans]
MRVVEKFHNEDSQNCFNCPFQFNRNKSRINFSTTLIYNFLELNTYVFVKIDKSIFGIIFICIKFFE